MKAVVIIAVVIIGLVLCGHDHHLVECRRHRERNNNDRLLLVFGDSSVDVGNLRKSSEKTRATRAWYSPYGSSDSAHANSPTGCLSDGLVLSDYLAKMLGSDESPPPYRLRRRGGDVSGSGGVNFALPFSGALNGPGEQLSLAGQIGQLRRLLNRGDIADADMDGSVALVSLAGAHDYSHAVNDTTGPADLTAYARDVTGEVVAAVGRLLDLGVSKVLVSSMPPIGCTPWRAGGATGCDGAGNALAATHNALLAQSLAAAGFERDEVLLLDLYTAFNAAAASLPASPTTPCCDADDDGYCGQEDASGRAQYTVCAQPSRYMYWDYIHPSQAGWKAVMDQLQPQIHDFLRASR